MPQHILTFDSYITIKSMQVGCPCFSCTLLLFLYTHLHARLYTYKYTQSFSSESVRQRMEESVAPTEVYFYPGSPQHIHRESMAQKLKNKLGREKQSRELQEKKMQ